MSTTESDWKADIIYRSVFLIVTSCAFYIFLVHLSESTIIPAIPVYLNLIRERVSIRIAMRLTEPPPLSILD